MKPNVETQLRNEGTLGANRRPMTFDVNSLNRLTLLVTDLYADPEGAVIREYPINGLDSHRAAGVDRPIEVQLPSQADPTFIVKDFGTGLSEYGVDEFFAKYGYSSKLETNDEAGMMGLGCKSALTYTRQFALCAVKDGLMTEVLVLRSLDEESQQEVPSIETVSVTPTDDPDGVTVYIPVNDITSFNRKAQEFFSYWKPGDVLVNGQEPEPPEGTWLDEDVLLVKRRDFSQSDTIVMGNIPYPVPADHTITKNLGMNNTRAIVWVPIGSVDPTPNREALREVPVTIDTCNEAREFVRSRLIATSQDRIDTCKTPVEATREYVKVLELFTSNPSIGINSRLPLTYQGKKFPSYITVPAGWTYTYSLDKAGQFGSHPRDLTQCINTKWITGHPTQTVSRRQKDKIRGYLDQRAKEADNKRDWNKVWLVADINEARAEDNSSHKDIVRSTYNWLEGAEIIPWEDIEAAEAQRRQAQASQTASTQPQPKQYRVLRDYRARAMEETELVDGTHLTYASSRLDNGRDDGTYNLAYALKHELPSDPDRMIVLMHPQSFSTFKRKFPHALSVRQTLHKRMRDLRNSLTPVGQVMVMEERGLRLLLRNLFKDLASHKILDPDVRAIAHSVTQIDYDDLAHKWRSMKRAWFNLHGYESPITMDTHERERMQSISERYPLLLIHGGQPEDYAEYINAMYERGKKDHA